MTETPLFVHPDSLRFTCTECGDCCRGWDVMLGPGEAQRLLELRWEGREEDLVGRRPDRRLALSGGGKRQALSRREDGSCIYLGANQRCRIHEHFGAEAKPLICRMFPFGFSAVGDHVAVDVSFACRAVSQESGAPLSKRVEEWTALLGAGPEGGAGTTHRFSTRYTIDGELLWELEHDVLRLLSERSLSLLDRVRAVLELLRLGLSGDPRTEAARRLRRIMTAEIPKQIAERPVEGGLDETQRAVFFHLLFVSLNPTPSSLAALTGRARKEEVRRRVAAAEGYRSKRARVWIDNGERDASFARVAATSPGILAEERGEGLLARYLSAKVLGQRFLREGERELTFLEGVPRLLLLYPTAVWTAKALAAERRRSRVEPEDATLALRLLDRSYGEIPITDLPSKQRKAWKFVLEETELPVYAMLELRNGSL